MNTTTLNAVINEVKLLAKQYNVKGCRKLALKTRCLFVIGKQCQKIEVQYQHEFLSRLQVIPHVIIEDAIGTYQMADNGFLDSVTIRIE